MKEEIIKFLEDSGRDDLADHLREVEESPRRIIFLDIDGVLNYQLGWENEIVWSHHEFKGHMYDPAKVKLIDDFCKEHGCSIVLSSTWRMGKTDEECIDMLREMGFTAPVLGKTLTSAAGCRGNEIYDYLMKSSYLPKNSKDYIIIDDDSDMLIGQTNNFLHVDSYVGVTPIGLYRAAARIGWI